ncbi:MAG: YceH family protein [Elusimicrobiota bacterium]
MIVELNDVQARVLGALVEKSLTTPDQYPLSLNSLILACNQKTSREPVMNLDEAAVGPALHFLLEKSLAGRIHEAGSRVPKFMHHIEMLLTGADQKTIATICVLLLRGAQTPGEIKTRTDRLCEFTSTAEVESLLQDLALREEPWVLKLPRQPGQKEVRYRQLFSGAPAPSASPASAPPAAAAHSPAAAPAPVGADRLTALERRVEALEALVKNLVPGAAPTENQPRG